MCKTRQNKNNYVGVYNDLSGVSLPAPECLTDGVGFRIVCADKVTSLEYQLTGIIITSGKYATVAKSLPKDNAAAAVSGDQYGSAAVAAKTVWAFCTGCSVLSISECCVHAHAHVFQLAEFYPVDLCKSLVLSSAYFTQAWYLYLESEDMSIVDNY